MQPEKTGALKRTALQHLLTERELRSAARPNVPRGEEKAAQARSYL